MRSFSIITPIHKIFLSSQMIAIFLLIVSQISVIAQKEKSADEQDAVKLNATLIEVPTIVLDRAGKFISDLSPKEFTVFEDGKRQEVSFFTSIKQPFNAVLVLDTSNSAEDRLRAIQHTAAGFTKELLP